MKIQKIAILCFLICSILFLNSACNKKNNEVVSGNQEEQTEQKTENKNTEESIKDRTQTKAPSTKAQDILNKLIDKNSATVVLLYAEYCPACRDFKPTFKNVLAKETQIKSVSLNVDEVSNKDLIKELDLKAIPTTMFFKKDGVFVEQITGSLTENEFKNEIEKIKN